MGIQNLLQILRSIHQRRHIREYKGQRVSVDAYCWLHKGIHHCAYELAKGIFTKKHIEYCIKRLDMLLNAGVVPIMVFDGAQLPMKLSVEVSRAKSRKLRKLEGDNFWREGKAEMAVKKYSEALEVTPEMAFEFIRVIKRRGVKFIVAPYEADAQIAYLYFQKHVSLVITEDSDLLAYGCGKVLYKMNKSGYGEEVNLADLTKASELDFTGFNKNDKFLKACILSGCDYLPSIKGIGFKTAHRLFSENDCIEKVLEIIRKDEKYIVPEKYEENFEKALLTFKFQTVFDPIKKKLTSLFSMDDTQYVAIHKYADKSFLGPMISNEIARKIAEGEIDPFSQRPYEDLQEEEEQQRQLRATGIETVKEPATKEFAIKGKFVTKQFMFKAKLGNVNSQPLATTKKLEVMTSKPMASSQCTNLAIKRKHNELPSESKVDSISEVYQKYFEHSTKRLIPSANIEIYIDEDAASTANGSIDKSPL